jgi:predicted O-linked N-acetylglucosamine transferase (SPINDLY family)
MAVSKILVRSNLDLQQNKIYNGGFEVVTALPTADFEGRQVYNSTDSKLYVCKKNTDGTFKWVAVGSNIKTISGDTAPTSADMTANDIANNEIFIWQDTTNSKSYLYQNVGGTPRKCGNEEQIQSDLSDLEERVSANETNIATNTSDIATNKADIETNAENITANATAIENNTKAIKDNTDAIAIRLFSVSKTRTLSANTTTEYVYGSTATETDLKTLSYVVGVFVLMNGKEYVVETKIDSTNKKVSISTNSELSNATIVILGY